MPKPIFGDNGSGMHVHQSLWAGGEPLFYDETGYGGLSDVARWYIGGLLHHAPSLLPLRRHLGHGVIFADARAYASRHSQHCVGPYSPRCDDR